MTVEETAFVKSSNLPLRALLTLPRAWVFGIPEEVPGASRRPEDGDVLVPEGPGPGADEVSAWIVVATRFA